MKFEAWKTMNSSLCPWSTPLKEGFRSGPYSLRCDLAFPIFVSHRWSAHLWVTRLIAFETQLTAVLHAGSLVSYHKFLSHCLYFNNRSKPGRSLLICKSVILFVDSLYAEAIEAAKSRAVLSASTAELILILGDMNSEVRLWNRYQSVNFWTCSESFLILTWSSMWNNIGMWCESKISETMTSDTDILVYHIVWQVGISRWGIVIGHCAEISNSCASNKPNIFSPEGFEIALFRKRV
jgi:hypothetical protein